MTIHRCPRPPERTTARTWSCPECGASYTWSKRMIGREMREGWYRNAWASRVSVTAPDREFDRTFNRMFGFAAAWAVVSFAVIVGLVVWIVLQVTT